MKALIPFSVLTIFDTIVNGLFLKNLSMEILLISSYCLVPLDLILFKKTIKMIITRHT